MRVSQKHFQLTYEEVLFGPKKIMHKLRFLQENPSHYEISEPLHTAEKKTRIMNHKSTD